MDAFRAAQPCVYLRWAQQAFDFVANNGWDGASGGGFWWNSAHTPAGQKAGEPLAAASLLGALLAQIYSSGACKGAAAATHAGAGVSAGPQTLASADEQAVEKFLAWGDQNFSSHDQYAGLYWRTGDDPTPTPYI